MSETTDLLRDMAERLFADACDKNLLGAAEKGEWPRRLWTQMEEAGLTSALVPESAGGSGLGIEDAMIALRIAARHAAPVPFAETLLASWLASGAGLKIPAGPLTIAPASKGEELALEKRDGGWRLTGRAQRVPYARNATAIVVLADFGDAPHVAIVDPKICTIEHGRNLAMEPRDNVVFDCDLGAADVAPAATGVTAIRCTPSARRCARRRSRARSAACSTSPCNYAQERVQFGKPISKFQAIQHNLAMLAAHSAAANAAADMAAEAAERDMNPLVIGAAKTRTRRGRQRGRGDRASGAWRHRLHAGIHPAFPHQAPVVVAR